MHFDSDAEHFGCAQRKLAEASERSRWDNEVQIVFQKTGFVKGDSMMFQDVAALTIVCGAVFFAIAAWQKRNARKADKNCDGCDGCPITSECHDAAAEPKSIPSEAKL